LESLEVKSKIAVTMLNEQSTSQKWSPPPYQKASVPYWKCVYDYKLLLYDCKSLEQACSYRVAVVNNC
jgi:hypothetical protein